MSWKASASDGGSRLIGYVMSAIPKVGLGLTVDVARLRPTMCCWRLWRRGFVSRVAVSAENALGRSTKASSVPWCRLWGTTAMWSRAVVARVVGFGSLAGAPSGLAGRSLPAPVVGLAATPDARATGPRSRRQRLHVRHRPSSSFELAGDHLRAPIVGIVAAPYGGGYWLVGAKGSVTTGSGPPVSSGRFRPGS